MGNSPITTLTLLFRAIYDKVSNKTIQTEDIKGFVRSFGKCIWEYDEGSEELDFSHSFLQSKVISASDNNTCCKCHKRSNF